MEIIQCGTSSLDTAWRSSISGYQHIVSVAIELLVRANVYIAESRPGSRCPGFYFWIPVICPPCSKWVTGAKLGEICDEGRDWPHPTSQCDGSKWYYFNDVLSKVRLDYEPKIYRISPPLLYSIGSNKLDKSSLRSFMQAANLRTVQVLARQKVCIFESWRDCNDWNSNHICSRLSLSLCIQYVNGSEYHKTTNKTS